MNRPLVVIFAAIGLDAVGIGLIFPILPRLLEDVTHTQNIAPYIGIMTALYAVMQFIFAPVLGALSDNLGRRPVLLISLAGAAINYVVMAFAPQLWMLLLGRAIAGLTSANISVATAYITDISPEDKRARRFGLFNAMFGIGFIIGPVLGGLLGDYWLRLPFIAAAVLNACNLLLALFILPESQHTGPPEDRSGRAQPASAAALGLLDEGASAYHPRVLHLERHRRGLRHLLGVVGLRRVPVEWPLDRPFAGHVRCLPNAGAGTLARPGDQTARRTRAVVVGIACACIALVVMAFANQGWIVFAIMPIFALGGIGTPAFQALAARQVDPARQGQLQGVLASACKLGVHRRAARFLDILSCRPEGVARSHLALGGRHFCNRGPAGFSRHPDRSPYAACVSLSRSEARCGSGGQYGPADGSKAGLNCILPHSSASSGATGRNAFQTRPTYELDVKIVALEGRQA